MISLLFLLKIAQSESNYLFTYFSMLKYVNKEIIVMQIKNNRGFTLVELIIVVAIIAILATVLAPQYLQFVERARQSSDLQMAQNFIDSLYFAAVDPEADVPSDAEIRIAWLTDGTRRYDGHITMVDDNNVPLPNVNLPDWAIGYQEIAFDTIEVSSDTSNGSPGGYGFYAFSDSAVSKEANLVIVIDMAAGTVKIQESSRAWVDEIGLNYKLTN